MIAELVSQSHIRMISRIAARRPHALPAALCTAGKTDKFSPFPSVRQIDCKLLQT
jgi:hypothetical protein